MFWLPWSFNRIFGLSLSFCSQYLKLHLDCFVFFSVQNYFVYSTMFNEKLHYNYDVTITMMITHTECIDFSPTCASKIIIMSVILIINLENL